MKKCSVVGCESLGRLKRGWCPKHYARWRAHGDTSKVLKVFDGTLQERLDFHTLKTSSCWLWKSTLSQGYGQVTYKRKVSYAHVESYRRYKGEIPKGMFVDHRPTCPKNCINPEHLRLASVKENGENRSGLPSNNTSGYLGVQWAPYANKWRAVVGHNSVLIHLGSFPSYELHVAGYKAMMKRLELFTHNDRDRKHFEQL